MRRSTYRLSEAAALLDIAMATAYDAAREDRFPVRVLRMAGLAGRARYRVPAAVLHEALGLPADADPDEVLAARGITVRAS